jgi:hypothetical protein
MQKARSKATAIAPASRFWGIGDTLETIKCCSSGASDCGMGQLSALTDIEG